MKVLSVRTVLALVIASGGGALPLIASCGNTTPAGLDYGSSGSAGSGSSSTPSHSGGSANNPDGGGSGSSSASDDGSGGLDATLVMYDGTPSMIVTDAGLGCTTANGLPIRFNPMYSGFDGTHTYQIPAFVPGTDPSKLTWGSTDPTMVNIQNYTGRPGVMLTTKKAGDVTIVAFVTGTSTCGTAPLHIEAYTPAQWDLGNSRYNNGNGLTITIDGSTYDGAIPTTLPDGAPIPDGAMFDASAYIPDAANLCATSKMYGNPFENPPAACTNCHGTMSNGRILGMTVFMDVQHTPEQTGGFSETDLTNVFVNGTVPPSGYFDNTIIDYCTWHNFHTWMDIATPEKQKGMAAYLRSLTPMEQVGCFELFTAGSPMCSDGGLGTGTRD
jgi:hypothetical protein